MLKSTGYTMLNNKSTNHLHSVPTRLMVDITMNTDQLLALQDHAIVTGNSDLRSDCWTALGYSSRYAFTPVTAGERSRALERCADQAEMLAAMGRVL